MSDPTPLPGLPPRPPRPPRRHGGTAGFEDRIKRFASSDVQAAALPPLHWPTVSATVALREWPELIAWVEELRVRYEVFADHKLIPVCWFRHQSLVGALQALKDHERVAYSSEAPGTAGVDWHRALRDIEALLKHWDDGPLVCSKQHEVQADPYEESDWEEFVANDIAKRRREDASVEETRAETREISDLVEAGVISSNGTILDDGPEVEFVESRAPWRPGPSSPAASGGASVGEDAERSDDEGGNNHV